MKYRQFHKFIVSQGWEAVRQTGSHIIYSKKGFPNVPVPYHASKEIPEPLRLSIKKQMGL